jgi:hypothetical protein
MNVGPEEFSRYYRSLSDDALLEVDRDELVETARRCYDEEVSRRGLSLDAELIEEPDFEDAAPALQDDEVEPNWLEDAACVCSFADYPGNITAPEMENARHVLEEDGIPCHISLRENEETSSARHTYDVMVPAKFQLRALSVLDREIFNVQAEADWKVHFEALSDEDLKAMDPKAMVAGWLDRVERLRRTYHAELDRRNIKGK